MRLTFLVAFVFGGCGKDDETARVECEEGSIAIDGECVVGGSGYEGEDEADDDGGTGGTGGTTGGGTTGGGGVSIDATLEILSPATGTRYAEEDKWIEVTFTVDGCTLKAPDASGDGCHIHRTINGAAYNDPDTVEDPLGWGHYSADPMSMYLGDPGGKNIRLVLVRNDGSDEPFMPQISDRISVILEGPDEPVEPDTGTPDTGTPDTGTPDTGTPDTGTPDTGTADGGAVEDTPACLVGGSCVTGITAEACESAAIDGEWYESGCEEAAGGGGDASTTGTEGGTATGGESTTTTGGDEPTTTTGGDEPTTTTGGDEPTTTTGGDEPTTTTGGDEPTTTTGGEGATTTTGGEDVATTSGGGEEPTPTGSGSTTDGSST